MLAQGDQYAKQTLSRMGMKKRSGPPMMSTGDKMAPKMSTPLLQNDGPSIQKSMSTALARGRRSQISRKPVSGYGPSYA